MLREARIILPLNERTKGDVLGVLGTIIDQFGGATILDGRGAWKAPDGTLHIEPGKVVDIAMDDQDASAAARLVKIARDFAAATGEQCVYVRPASGNVQFVEPTAALVAA